MKNENAISERRREIGLQYVFEWHIQDVKLTQQQKQV